MSGTVSLAELHPGDALVDDMGVAIFVSKNTPHPLYPSLALVIWYLPLESRHSFDALDVRQQLTGRVDPTSRELNLRAAFGMALR
jgi:hypothetical protein